MLLGAKLTALFVLAGGAIGGLTAWTALFAFSLLRGQAASHFELEWLGQFFVFAPIAGVVGIVLGCIPATVVAWTYNSGPPQWRAYWAVALNGALTSALMGVAVDVGLFRAVDAANVVGVVAAFCFSGVVAAASCHWIAKRWPEFAPET